MQLKDAIKNKAISNVSNDRTEYIVEEKLVGGKACMIVWINCHLGDTKLLICSQAEIRHIDISLTKAIHRN